MGFSRRKEGLGSQIRRNTDGIPTLDMTTSTTMAGSGIEPLELVILGEDGAVRLTAGPVILLLRVDAVQCGRVVAAADENADVNVRGA